MGGDGAEAQAAGVHPLDVDGLARLHEEADLVVCPHPLEEIAVVGQAYESFDPLEEWYLAGLLADPGPSRS